MATARELLQQADALMRRNRQNEPDLDIPELTEVVGVEDTDVGEDSVADFGGTDQAPSLAPETPPAQALAADDRRGPDTIPVLTEVIADPAPPVAEAPREETREPTISLAPWPEEGAAIVWTDAPEFLPLPPVAPPAKPAAAPVAESTERDAAQWERLAEDIRMQVLQRIDIFTDTGLQEQLTERLQPIVDRASADLVATINQHVGQLLRTYVAEAIEREIDKWRQGGS